MLGLLFPSLFLGCGGDKDPTGAMVPEVDRIVLSPSPVTAHVDDYVWVRASALDENGNPVPAPGLEWAIENTSLAFISIKNDTIASVWGRAPGITAISASFGGKTARLELPVEPMVIARMTLVSPVMAVEAGTERTLELIQWNPHNMPARNPTAVWSSSDPSVATVDQQGRLSGVSAGTVQIRAVTDTLVATATVHVPTAFTAVTVGAFHSCGLKSDGRVFCWGGNNHGQLGDDTRADNPVPNPVITEARFTSLHGLSIATCAGTAAGDVYCWGYNADGRLGVGTGEVLSPTRVTAPEPLFNLSAGSAHICGLGVSGTGYCWGWSTGAGAAPGSTLSSPTALSAPLRFTALAAGDTHTCALGTDRRAYCWGGDVVGQLGDGAPDPFPPGRSSIEPVAGDREFESLVAGSRARHTCAMTTQGEWYCWGAYVENISAPTTIACIPAQGKGGSVTYCSPSPVRVTSPVTFRVIAPGSGTCGLTDAGEMYCWGTAQAPRVIPTDVRFQTISLGLLHQCGVSTTGAIFCWGSNSYWQLGDYSGVPIPPFFPYGKPSSEGPSLIASP